MKMKMEMKKICSGWRFIGSNNQQHFGSGTTRTGRSGHQHELFLSPVADLVMVLIWVAWQGLTPIVQPWQKKLVLAVKPGVPI